MNVGRMSMISFGVFLVGILGLAAVIGNDLSAPVIVVYLLVVVLSFVYAMYLWIAVMRYGDRRLLKRGIKGTARVSSAKETSPRKAFGVWSSGPCKRQPVSRRWPPCTLSR